MSSRPVTQVTLDGVRYEAVRDYATDDYQVRGEVRVNGKRWNRMVLMCSRRVLDELGAQGHPINDENMIGFALRLGVECLHPMMKKDIERMTDEDDDYYVTSDEWSRQIEQQQRSVEAEEQRRENQRLAELEERRRSEQAVLEANPLFGMF